MTESVVETVTEAVKNLLHDLTPGKVPKIASLPTDNPTFPHDLEPVIRAEHPLLSEDQTNTEQQAEAHDRD